jgi:hypothetical protein
MSHACNNISKNWVAIFNKNLLWQLACTTLLSWNFKQMQKKSEFWSQKCAYLIAKVCQMLFDVSLNQKKKCMGANINNGYPFKLL